MTAEQTIQYPAADAILLLSQRFLVYYPTERGPVFAGEYINRHCLPLSLDVILDLLSTRPKLKVCGEYQRYWFDYSGLLCLDNIGLCTREYRENPENRLFFTISLGPTEVCT